MQIDDLDAISPWVAKVASKTRDQFEPVFSYEFVSHFSELRLIADHDAEVAAPLFTTRSFVFEHGQELMFTQSKEGVALSFVQLFQAKDVDIERDSRFDIADLDRDMITAIHLDAHS